MDIRKPLEFVEQHRFSFISWSATGLLVVALLGSALWWTQFGSAAGLKHPDPTAAPQDKPTVVLPSAATGHLQSGPGIGRALDLKTSVSGQADLKPITYKVQVGDSVFAIAKQFSIKPESILYSNEGALNDNPANLSPGMKLEIPPVDGLLYTWQQGDTIDSIATKFKVKPENILNFPGNNLDLTSPKINPGTVVMIPGGQRELVAWLEFVPSVARNGASTASSELSPSGCKVGFGSPPSLWPTTGPHTLSGNNFGPTHLGIDITATLNMPILASGAGVVVFAGFSQYGYGNVVQIDHGDGFSTVYAHLNGFNVTQCQTVQAGQIIGYAGTTGNSTGVHLHFEVRQGGNSINPWDIVH